MFTHWPLLMEQTSPIRWISPGFLLIVALGLGTICDGQNCELSFHMASPSLMLLEAKNASVLCDGRCFHSREDDVRVMWQDSNGNTLGVVPGGLYAITYNHALMSRLVFIGASISQSGNYICSVLRNNRVVQQKVLNVYVYGQVSHVDIINVPRDQGPRRGDMAPPEEIEINYRPVRSAESWQTGDKDPASTEEPQIRVSASQNKERSSGQSTEPLQIVSDQSSSERQNRKTDYSSENEDKKTDISQPQMFSDTFRSLDNYDYSKNQGKKKSINWPNELTLKKKFLPPPIFDYDEIYPDYSYFDDLDMQVLSDWTIGRLKPVLEEMEHNWQEGKTTSDEELQHYRDIVGSVGVARDTLIETPKSDNFDLQIDQNAHFPSDYTDDKEGVSRSELSDARSRQKREAFNNTMLSNSTNDGNFNSTAAVPTQKKNYSISEASTSSSLPITTTFSSKTTTDTTSTTSQSPGYSITNPQTPNQMSSDKTETGSSVKEESAFGKYGVIAFASAVAVCFLLLYAMLMIIFMPRILAKRNSRDKSDAEAAIYRKKNSASGDIAPLTLVADEASGSSGVENDLDQHNTTDLDKSLISENDKPDDSKNKESEEASVSVSTFLLRQNSEKMNDTEETKKEEQCKEDTIPESTGEKKTEELSSPTEKAVAADRQSTQMDGTDSSKPALVRGLSLMESLLPDLNLLALATESQQASNDQPKSSHPDDDLLPPPPNFLDSHTNV